MATYNTAFGSLPSPETLTGYKPSTDQDEEEPRNRLQQYSAEQQSQQQAPQQPPPSGMTFAQMQEQGIARPAPPPPQPAPSPTVQQTAQVLGTTAPQPVSQPAPMLSQLQQQLQPMASVPPMPTMQAAETTGGDSLPMGPDGEMPAGPDGTGGTTTFNPRNPPPANPPEGSTFMSQTGAVWTRRGGQWVTEVGPGQTMPTGYAGLRPPELGPGQGTGESWLDAFLTQHGLPENQTQVALLANTAGLPVQRVQQLLETSPLRTFWDRARTQETAAWAESTGYQDPFGGRDVVSFAGGPFRGQVQFVRASEGGPGIRIPPNAVERMVSGSPFLRQNPQNQAQLQAILAPIANQVFPSVDAMNAAIAQAEALAREANPDLFAGGTAGEAGGGAGGPGGAGGGFGGGAGGLTGFTSGIPEFRQSEESRRLFAELQSILGDIRANANPFESEAFKASLASAEADLNAQFKSARQRLEERLARQGLSASTFGAGAYANVEEDQARAMSAMRAGLLRDAANQQAESQRTLLQGATQIAGLMSQNELAAFNANLDRYRTSRQFEIDVQRLQQDAQFRGIELSLQQARDLALQNFQNRSLDLQLQELFQRGTLTREELALRQLLGLREIDSREGLGGRQISGQLLSNLLGMLDLSGLTSEQLQELFRSFGFTLPGGLNLGGGNNSGGGGGNGTGGPLAPPLPPGNGQAAPEDVERTLGPGFYEGDERVGPDGKTYRWSTTFNRWIG